MKFLRLSCTLLIAAGLAGTASAQQGMRPEVGKPLQQASEMLKAGKAKEALAMVREADAVPNKTPAEQLTIKIEGAVRVGERAILLAGSADPRVIANAKSITAGVEKTVRELTPPRPDKPYQIFWRVYGIDAVFPWATPPDPLPREVFFMCECIADTAEVGLEEQKAVEGA